MRIENMSILISLFAGFGITVFILICFFCLFIITEKSIFRLLIKIGGLKNKHKNKKTKYYQIIEIDYCTYKNLVIDYENQARKK